MTDYQLMVKALFKDFGDQHKNILHAFVGQSGELGELIDAVKKHWAYDKPLDRDNVLEELGDLHFYMTAFEQTISLTVPPDACWEKAAEMIRSSPPADVEYILKLLLGMQNAIGYISSGLLKQESSLADTLRVAMAYTKVEVAFAVLAQYFGYTMQEIEAANMDKLSKRYPDKVFKSEHAQQRLDKAHETPSTIQ